MSKVEWSTIYGSEVSTDATERSYGTKPLIDGSLYHFVHPSSIAISKARLGQEQVYHGQLEHHGLRDRAESLQLPLNLLNAAQGKPMVS